MKQKLFHFGIGIIVLAIVAFAAKSFLRQQPRHNIPVKSMGSWQQADAPLGFPVDGKIPPFDFRFIQLTAFERANIPTAPHYSSPMGSEHGALTYNAQPFWANNLKRGGHHTGDDLNGIGGQNTDLGDPVYAVGNGLVIFKGRPSAGWGNVIMLAHRLPNGQIQISMYAHLQKILIAYGDLVARGQKIATVGSADGIYLAHLHFEMRDSTGVFIGRGYASHKKNHLPPSETISKHQNTNNLPLLPIIRKDQEDTQNEEITIKHEI